MPDEIQTVNDRPSYWRRFPDVPQELIDRIESLAPPTPFWLLGSEEKTERWVVSARIAAGVALMNAPDDPALGRRWALCAADVLFRSAIPT